MVAMKKSQRQRRSHIANKYENVYVSWNENNTTNLCHFGVFLAICHCHFAILSHNNARAQFFFALLTITPLICYQFYAFYLFSCILHFRIVCLFAKMLLLHVKCGSSAIYLGLLWFPFGNGARDNEHTFAVIHSVDKMTVKSSLEQKIYMYIVWNGHKWLR